MTTARMEATLPRGAGVPPGPEVTAPAVAVPPLPGSSVLPLLLADPAPAADPPRRPAGGRPRARAGGTPPPDRTLAALAHYNRVALPAAEKSHAKVYLYLLGAATGGSVRVSQVAIARAIGMAEPTVSRAVQWLEGHEVLEVTRMGKWPDGGTNVYRLLTGDAGRAGAAAPGPDGDGSAGGPAGPVAEGPDQELDTGGRDG